VITREYAPVHSSPKRLTEAPVLRSTIRHQYQHPNGSPLGGLLSGAPGLARCHCSTRTAGFGPESTVNKSITYKGRHDSSCYFLPCPPTSVVAFALEALPAALPSAAVATAASAGLVAAFVAVWSAVGLAAVMVPAASWKAEPPPQAVSRAKVHHSPLRIRQHHQRSSFSLPLFEAEQPMLVHWSLLGIKRQHFDVH